MKQLGESTTLDHLRALVSSVVDAESESVRAANARTAAEAALDLRDVAALASAIVPAGSRVQDMLLASGPLISAREAANDRERVRMFVDQVRAAQLTTDTPGVLPRPFEPGRGITELGFGLDLVRRFATSRSFLGEGKQPVVPGVVAGDTLGAIQTEGSEPASTPFTLADVGDGEARVTALASALLSRQLLDWNDANGVLDRILTDICDRAAETHLAGRLVSEAGGTRTAGAANADLVDGLDEAESAATAAVNGGSVALVVHPQNLPVVRRAVAESWTAQLPHPAVGSSIGLAAGTAVMVALDSVVMLAEPVQFLRVATPATFGQEAAAGRGLYLALRDDAGVQTVTGIA